MDRNSKKDNLKLIYTICLRELNTARMNINLCVERVNELALFISDELDKPHDSQVHLLTYHKVLTDISHMSDFIRKFNVKCELTILDKINEFCSNKLKGIEIRKEQTTQELEQFTYSKLRLDKYKKNLILDCLITFIKDKTNGIFYMNDMNGNIEYKQCTKELIKYKESTPIVLDHYPHQSELFGLIIDGYMFRAVRENNQCFKRDDRSVDSFNAFLIDTGEIFNVTLNNMNAYLLPPQCIELPGQAILCKLEMFNSNDNFSVEEYLENNLYTKTEFIVIKNESSIIHVSLGPNSSPFRNVLRNEDNDDAQVEEVQTISDSHHPCYYKDEGIRNIMPNDINNAASSNIKSIDNTVHHRQLQQQQQLYNNTLKDFNNLELFRENDLNRINHIGKEEEEAAKLINFSDSDENDNTLHENVLAVTCNKLKQQNNESNLYSSNDHNNDNNNYNKKLRNNGQYQQQNPHHEITDQELATLQEGPLNTTNALKAVAFGCIPKDDKRICPFYNPRTKSCFKGSRCKLEHIQNIPDGWTRCEAEMNNNVLDKIFLPPKGNVINLHPTYVINMEYFYAQYWANELHYSKTIKDLLLQMNSEKEKARYTPLNDNPVPLQLVIAKHYDNVWYRARIIDVFDDFTYGVFYVDFGGTDIIKIDKIRKWETKFDYLPFQAIKCRMAGIEAKKEDSVKNSGIEHLKKMILNRVLKAKIVDYVHEDELLVQLYDENDFDLGEQLILFGYANEKPITFMYQDQLLPG